MTISNNVDRRYPTTLIRSCVFCTAYVYFQIFENNKEGAVVGELFDSHPVFRDSNCYVLRTPVKLTLHHRTIQVDEVLNYENVHSFR